MRLGRLSPWFQMGAKQGHELPTKLLTMVIPASWIGKLKMQTPPTRACLSPSNNTFNRSHHHGNNLRIKLSNSLAQPYFTSSANLFSRLRVHLIDRLGAKDRRGNSPEIETRRGKGAGANMETPPQRSPGLLDRGLNPPGRRIGPTQEELLLRKGSSHDPVDKDSADVLWRVKIWERRCRSVVSVVCRGSVLRPSVQASGRGLDQPFPKITVRLVLPRYRYSP